MKYRDINTGEIVDRPISSNLIRHVVVRDPVTKQVSDQDLIGLEVEEDIKGLKCKAVKAIGKFLSSKYRGYCPINRVLIQESILQPRRLAHGWISTPYDEDDRYFEINNRCPDADEVYENDYYLEKYIVDEVYERRGNDWVLIWQIGDII